MRHRAGSLLLLLAAAACDPTKAPAKTYPCESDDECVVSCSVAGDCCGEGCGCTKPYHVDELHALREANQRKCEGKELDCPEYKCAEFAPLEPKCQAGTCVAVEQTAEP